MRYHASNKIVEQVSGLISEKKIKIIILSDIVLIPNENQFTYVFVSCSDLNISWEACDTAGHILEE